MENLCTHTHTDCHLRSQRLKQKKKKKMCFSNNRANKSVVYRTTTILYAFCKKRLKLNFSKAKKKKNAALHVYRPIVFELFRRTTHRIRDKYLPNITYHVKTIYWVEFARLVIVTVFVSVEMPQDE